jgi:protease secretion system outer membrane protein
VIVGRDITELDPMAEDFRIQPMKPASFDEWKAIALAHNPDIAAQQYAVDAAQQEVNKNRAGHLPRIDFVASVSRGKSETISTLNQDLSVRSVGFQLTMPIFSGGATEASTVQAVAGKEKAKSDLEAKTSQVMVDLRKQYSQAVSSMTRVDALVKSVKSASLLVDATRQSIKGGERINLDLLNAQQQLFAAKRDLAQARYTYLVAYLRLRADAGTLSEDDLRTVASYFRHGGSVEAGGASVAAAGQASAQSAQETSVVLRKNAPEVRLVGQKPGQILVGKESGGG